MVLPLIISGYVNAQSPTRSTNFDIIGGNLPTIRHMIDMKVSGDTLLFVYEGEDSYGQRLLRRAVIDCKNNTLAVSPDMGKREDGYFVSYMPYPFITDDGTIRVISQDDCEIYAIENDTTLVRTKQYLMTGNSTVPFPISQYVQDVFMTGPDNYVFIGREPKGGRQYAMKADLTTAKIDTIRQINISPELQSWMPNAGELAYSGKHCRLAFAYKFHPAIEIFGLDGSAIKMIKICDDTFDPKTLCNADFEMYNPVHFADISTTADFIYALYKGVEDNDADKSIIYQIDWNGNIFRAYSLTADLQNLVAYNNDLLIGWDGKRFIIVTPQI